MDNVDTRLKSYFALMRHYRASSPELQASMRKGTIPNHRDHAALPRVVTRLNELLQSEGIPNGNLCTPRSPA